MKPIDAKIAEYVKTAAESEPYVSFVRDVLMELVAINTAPDADLSATAAREQALFDVIERRAKEALGDAAVCERTPINPAIGDDPDYSLPGYAADKAGQVPPAKAVYAGRSNLQISVGVRPAGPAPKVLLHAHADVVPPWFAPKVEGQRITGRGSCDNKAQIALLLAQMRLLREVQEKFGVPAAGGRVYQFTLDEEIGGNGSVSAALDPRFARVPVLMHESTDLVPYCAHRGCVYYRCRLSVGRNTEMSAVELFPFVVLSLETEGRKLQRETNHPGFSAAHVQTNHGVLGHFGEHPGSVCDHVAVDVVARTNANPQRLALKLTQFLEEAAAEYVNRYGDKTRELDPATGKPKVERHFAVTLLPSVDTQNIRVDVWGRSGHMAAVRECDSAITKAALLFGGLLKAASKYPNIQAWGRLAEAEMPASNGAPTSASGIRSATPSSSNAAPEQFVILEGGQGFTPSHALAEVKKRMADAAHEAVKKFCRLRGRRYDDSMVEMSFDRLHNDAYADSPECEPMQALASAFAAVGRPLPPPVAWTTSCDARIYHHKGHAVAIFGAGKLDTAHSDSEYIDLPDVQKALAISTLATLAMIG
jgi:acetylornithine deacetylase/succinyl-diaminopimelate desuccinylase-like protein